MYINYKFVNNNKQPQETKLVTYGFCLQLGSDKFPGIITWYMGTLCHTTSKIHIYKFVTNSLRQLKLVINIYAYKFLLLRCIIMKLCTHVHPKITIFMET